MKPRIHFIITSVVLTLLAGNALAQTNTISTVAGTGTAGSGGDSGQATAAQLNGPFGVSVDAAGNIYISDWQNNRVRKVDTSGVITTVAGADGSLNGPDDVAVDSAGNLYIADSTNNRIRKVDTSGNITTVAGTGAPGFNGDGLATTKNVSSPSGVALDGKGSLYIADDGNQRVRKLDLSSGMITTIAGTGTGGFSGDGGPATSAELYNPTRVAVDAAGNVYIADYINNRIRKVDTSGTITTIAGSGTTIGFSGGGFEGDGGPATSAQFFHPAGIAIDKAGNLYVADGLNKRIRKIAAGTGIVTTIAGGGTNGDGCNAVTAALNAPLGVALNPAQNVVYIADYGDNRVRAIGTAEIATVPKIDSITPSAGINGKSYQVTLSGSGFIVGGGGGGCSNGTTTVGISGAGITASGVSITNDTVTMTLTVSMDAASGSRDVAVTNSSGTSNAVQFSVGLPTPSITSISPSAGSRGQKVTVTIIGSNFAGGSGTTVKISAGGITAGNVTVQSDTSLTAVFDINTAATIGKYFVAVSTSLGGDSNTVPFTVSSSTPQFTSISPSSGVRGTTVQVTLLGTNFSAASPTVKVNPTGITVSNVTIKSDTSMTATFTVSPTAGLGDYLVFLSSTGGGDSGSLPFSVNPQGPTITYGVPQLLNPTQQVPLVLQMPGGLPDEVSGVVTLVFNANAVNNADDPNATFVGKEQSTRTVGFRFAPNATTADFGLTSAVLQAGTVAGTIRLSLSDVKVAGQVVTSNSVLDVTIPALPPVITNVRLLNRTSGGFVVEVTGYSTTREITQATFQFAAGSGGNLQTAQSQPDITGTFTAYYQSPNSVPAGSAFVYTQPFIAEQGDANVVTSVTVTLSNSKGTSDPKTAN